MDTAPKFKGHVDGNTLETCNDMSIFKNPILQFVTIVKDLVDEQRQNEALNTDKRTSLNIKNTFERSLEQGPRLLE